MRRRRRTKGAWGAVLALGAGIGVLVGGIAIAHRASAKAGPQPPPAPPTPADILALPVTDPGVVRYWQTEIANGLGSGLTFPGISAADYGTGDVDGNPNNPRWMHVVAVFQAFANDMLSQPEVRAKLPAGFPTTLRTDGVFDQATAVIMDKF